MPGGFIETVTPTAFNKTLGDSANVLARADHSDILGSVKAGSLTLRVDNVGLDYTVDPVVETRAGKDTLAMARGNLLQGSSFAFEVMGDEGDDWSNDGGILLRSLLSVRLIDVAPCVGPVAYDSTSVSLRSLAAKCDAPLDDVLELARDGKLPTLVSRSDNRLQPRPETAGALNKRISAALSKKNPPTSSVSPSERRKMLTDMRYPPEPPKTVSGRQCVIEMMREPQPRKTLADRRKELTDMYAPYQTAAMIGMED